MNHGRSSRNPRVAPGGNAQTDDEDRRRTLGARELRQFRAAKDFLQKRLDGSFRKLFREVTGLQLHLIWHGPFDSEKSGIQTRTCPELAESAAGIEIGRATCLTCLERNWSLGDPAILVGSRFLGTCGFSTFRAAVTTTEGPPPLTLGVQALIRKRAKVGAAVTSDDAFECAVTLVRLIKHDLEMALRAEKAEVALARLKRRLPVLRKEERLVQTLKRQGDPLSPVIGSNRGGHKQRVAQRMVAYVHEHFHHPMSLTQVATELGMNAAYLSDLFSRQLGMTFREYLLEVRMARARQLLLSPHRRINEVACAVGYSSADQFRHAFKAHAGVSPSEWR